MRRSLASTLKEWYKARTSKTKGDILVIEESFLERELDRYDTTANVLLVVGLNGRSRTTEKIKRANFVSVLPPVGPIRMSQALKVLYEEKKRRGQGKGLAIRSPDTAISLLPSVEPVQPGAVSPTQSMVKMALPERRPNGNANGASVQLYSPAKTLASNNNEFKEAILLVDDNHINLRILLTVMSRLNLQAQGVHTLTATNGLEALNAYTTAINGGARIPIILMDISMPVMDGFTATREIRAFEQARGMEDHVKSTIIAVTGLASVEAQKEVEHSGFDLYLRKPVGLKTVREILASHMVKPAPE